MRDILDTAIKELGTLIGHSKNITFNKKSLCTSLRKDVDCLISELKQNVSFQKTDINISLI